MIFDHLTTHLYFYIFLNKNSLSIYFYITIHIYDTYIILIINILRTALTSNLDENNQII